LKQKNKNIKSSVKRNLEIMERPLKGRCSKEEASGAKVKLELSLLDWPDFAVGTGEG